MLREFHPVKFILPSLAGVSLFLLVPYIDVLFRSFWRMSDGRFAGLDNYREVICNEAFRLAMKNTFLFDLVCIPLLLIGSLLIALFLFEGPRGAGVLKTGFLIPMAIPTASVVLMWRFLFDQQGILNGILTGSGHAAVHWMDSGIAFWILVGSYIWRNLGYNLILWLAALSTVPRSSTEAARLDAAGPLARLRYVILPHIRGASFVIIVLALLNSFKVFREAYLVAGDYPDSSIYMIQNLFNNWFLNLDTDKMAAGATIDSAILILLILLLQRTWEMRGETDA